MMDTNDLQHHRRRRLAVITFLALSFACGLLFALLTPPYQAPDEAAHFFRAYSLSEGQFLLREQSGIRGDMLPASLIDSRRAFRPLLGNSDQKITLDWLRSQLTRPADRDRRVFTDLEVTAVYSPVPYLSQAAGIAAARIFDAPLLGSLYAARAGNVIVSTAIIAAAIWLVPFGRWCLALFALLPMAVFLRGSSSGDPISTALAFLLFALIVHLGWSAERPRGPVIAAMLITIVLVALTKPGYCALALLSVAVPIHRFPSRRRAILFHLSVWLAVAAGAALFFMWLASNAPPPTVEGTAALEPRETLAGSIDPGAQLSLMVSQPFDVLRTLMTDLIRHGPRYLAHFIGRLGWLDTPLPLPLLGGYCLALVVILLTTTAAAAEITFRTRLLAALILLATLLGISLTMYLVWTPVGASTVEGVQGRYFHPIAPLVILLFANRRFALRGKAAAWFPLAFLSANAIGLALTAAVILARYYE